jgi:GDP-mannose 6-dehydrogenase
MIYSLPGRKIGFLGFAFKAGTDDLRESPIVDLIETLIGKGYEVKVYDSNVHLSSLMGKNKEYINNHIPHIYKLLVKDLQEIIDFSDTLIIGNKAEEFKGIVESTPSVKHIIDLVRIDKTKTSKDNYIGICW